MPSHSHRVCYVQGANSYNSLASSGIRNGDVNTENTGGSGSHTHSLSGTATIALNVKYTDVIICSKN